MEYRYADENTEAGSSSCAETVGSRQVLKTSGFGNAETDGESSECDEVVEEMFVHVVLDSIEDTSTINANSNVRVKALETDSPVLQIENKASGILYIYLIVVSGSNFHRHPEIRP